MTMRADGHERSPSAVNQGARRILYVEGQPEPAKDRPDAKPPKSYRDIQLLKALVDPTGWALRAAGNSMAVRSAAEAFAVTEPGWAFVVDRDDLPDSAVEKKWAGFLMKPGANLLIWRRKELESYFLEPAWLQRSRWLKPGVELSTLEAAICAQMRSQLWPGLVSRVLAQARFAVKNNPAGEATGGARPVEARDKGSAWEAIRDDPALKRLAATAQTALSEDSLKQAFDDGLKELTAGDETLTWGHGRWRDLLPAKSTFNHLVNQYFRFEVTADQPKVTVAQGAIKLAEDLFTDHKAAMPADFAELVERLRAWPQSTESQASD